jgi:FMN-dependent NADH-azoreductase
MIMTTTVAGYRDGAIKDYDFLPRYMKTILNQVGVDDVTTIWHEGIENLLVDAEQESIQTERIIQQRVSSIINTST